MFNHRSKHPKSFAGRNIDARRDRLPRGQPRPAAPRPRGRPMRALQRGGACPPRPRSDGRPRRPPPALARPRRRGLRRRRLGDAFRRHARLRPGAAGGLRTLADARLIRPDGHGGDARLRLPPRPPGPPAPDRWPGHRARHRRDALSRHGRPAPARPPRLRRAADPRLPPRRRGAGYRGHGAVRPARLAGPHPGGGAARARRAGLAPHRHGRRAALAGWRRGPAAGGARPRAAGGDRRRHHRDRHAGRGRR